MDPINEDSISRGDHPDQQRISDAVKNIRTEIQKVIVGQDDLLMLLITGLFAGGHLLIEGVPGIAKTLVAKLLAKTLSIKFSRIQFTPDLMPSDVTGTSVFNFKNSEFIFNRGPVFSNIVLIDEINRSPAKTQAALFEVMEEQQVTVDGSTYRMEFPFMVLATQNPIEQEGTYKLPEAQLDRFLFRVKINYPSLEEETKIIALFKEDFSNRKSEEVQPVFSAADIAACRQLTERVHIKDELVAYIAQIVHQTRNHGDLFLGASPRASLAMLRSSKALAAIKGRDFVTPDDIRFVSYPVLNHRIILTPEREMEGMEVEEVISEIIRKIEVPR
ncbi:MAG: MoxR family ATPase [Chitinophagales bacterium]|nr:MoxR family ATPase [Chitinophagales bacterium]